MSRLPRLMALALIAWLLCFAVLARSGTWTPFAFVGVLLTALVLQSAAVPVSELRASHRSVLLGAGAGVSMVLLTHLSYGALSASFPTVRAGTLELLALLNVEGFSPAARAALIVVIASCEEVLFRGLLPSPLRQRHERLRWPLPREWAVLVGWSMLYALTTLPLASPLLIMCAFICGTVWGGLRLATGSTLVPILAHVLWDLGVLLIWPLPP